jgi:transposase InsO family protein
MLKKLGTKVDGAIIHTDHGSVYTSHVYQEWLKKHKVIQSMGRVGNSLDNYLIEHHFSNLKRECLWDVLFKDRSLKNIKAILEDYYLWYNNKRIQRCLGGTAPVNYANSNRQIKNRNFFYNLVKRTGPVLST